MDNRDDFLFGSTDEHSNETGSASTEVPMSEYLTDSADDSVEGESYSVASEKENDDFSSTVQNDFAVLEDASSDSAAQSADTTEQDAPAAQYEQPFDRRPDDTANSQSAGYAYAPAYRQGGYQQQTGAYQNPPYGGYQQGGYQQSGYQQGAYQQGGYRYGGYQQPNYSQSPYQTYGNPPTPAGNNQPPKKKKTGLKAFFIILAAVVLILAVAIPVSLFRNRAGSSGTDTDDEGKYQLETGGETATTNDEGPGISIKETPKSSGSSSGALTPSEIYEKSRESIVAIMIYQNERLSGEGTGIIYGEDASHKYTYILTCAHMFSSLKTECTVQMEDGERYEAEIVGYDVRTDVGICKIKKTGLKAAEFGDSDQLKVGDPVYALGNPGGSEFFGTFTDGIVSAIGRTITSSVGYDMICIQHNAAISPGNSGGALCNQYGQVIGINSSKIAATDYEGISFAIPITQAKEVIDSIVKYGYVPGRPMLGISYLPNNSSNLSGIYSMVVQLKDLPSGSLVIYSIDEDSDLRNTEAKAGDMIIAVNGKKLDTADVLLELIENSKVGDTLTLTLFRVNTSGRQYTTDQFDVKVKLIEENNTKAEEETTASSNIYSFDFGDFGF